MPRLDGTGPNGEGPRTGFQRGCCSNRKPYCEKRLRCYEQRNLNQDDLKEEKEVLEERLNEINSKLDKDGE